jgi:hypothetical protein
MFVVDKCVWCSILYINLTKSTNSVKKVYLINLHNYRLALPSTQDAAHYPTHNLAAHSRADVAHSRLDHHLRQALALTAARTGGAKQGVTQARQHLIGDGSMYRRLACGGCGCPNSSSSSASRSWSNAF